MGRARLAAHHGRETKEDVARAHDVAVPRRSASLADGNTVNRAVDIAAIHPLVVRPRAAQARLARAVLVDQGD